MPAETMPVWERRFRAPAVTFPRWARHAPDRLVYATNEPGAYQLFVRSSSAPPRQVTDVAIGVMHGTLTHDGALVVWFDDTTGDETGRWVTQPFTGGATRPLTPDTPEGWSEGLAVGERHVAEGLSLTDGTGYRVYIDGAERHHHREPLTVAAMSRDDHLVVYAHAERGDPLHQALRVLDVATAGTVAELDDGPEHGLDAVAFSPTPGDQRLAIVTERSGALRPAVWDPTTGERTDLDLDELAGDVTVADWWPDASALLLVQHHEGRDQLVRYDLATRHGYAIGHTPGQITGAAVRPDGDVWYAHASGALPPTIRSAVTGDEVLAPDAEPAPNGHPYRSWHFENRHGDTVHGFVVEPPGDGPHPTVMLVHGGPHWQWSDGWRPEVPAWVDHGFAVALVNYRGSTGYGPAWRDALTGDPGFTELDDLVAGLDDLVAAGVADPARVVLAGRSWGGYLTLLGLGRHPDRWKVGDAVVPVADYVAAYEDEAPGLKALDSMLFGGSPDEKPELYRERSPITYVDAVVAPVLVIAGDNDSRCPIRQILNYVDALERRGRTCRLHRYEAGHGSMVVDERVEHMRLELEFVLEHL